MAIVRVLWSLSGFGICLSAASASAGNKNHWGVSINASHALGGGISFKGKLAYTATDYGTLSPSGTPVPMAVGVDPAKSTPGRSTSAATDF